MKKKKKKEKKKNRWCLCRRHAKRAIDGSFVVVVDATRSTRCSSPHSQPIMDSRK